MRKTMKWFLCLMLVAAVVFGSMTVMAEESTSVAKNIVTGATYEDLATALNEATAGQTITVQQDTNVGFLSVPVEVALDLNGKIVTAAYASVFGNVVDNSDANTGALKVDENKLLINNDNTQLPVKTDKGYQFVEVVGFHTSWMNENTFVFQPLFEEEAHAMLKNGVANTGVSIQVKVTWRPYAGSEDLDSRTFKYGDTLVTEYINSYKADTEKYGRMFTLTLVNPQNYVELACTAKIVSDTGVDFEPVKMPAEVTEEVQLTNEQASAIVPVGTKLKNAGSELTLNTTEMEKTTSDVVLTDGETMLSMDVHVDGIAADNTVPVIVTLNEITMNGLNEGNIALYHVENGETVEMTRVYTIEEVNEHNEYYYDIATGTITMALKSFSEVAVVAETSKAWNGTIATGFNSGSGTVEDPYIIANADQLAYFGKAVGGMGEDLDPNSFAGKYIKLISDINLGDDEENNDSTKIFYPIGYYSSDEKYEKTGVAITSGLRIFEGTFDGNGHTVSNFYQNTWEMKGDHDWYSPEEQYYRDGMGLFGRVYGGTVKNLTVKNFSSDGEIATTGCIAAYADFGATFENIAIFNCNPRVYNIGNGGIVGCVGWYTKGETTIPVTFKNITVDNTNKISALWGSYDVACGGIVGQYYPTSGQTSAGSPKNAGISLVNCHVAAQMDVYNDVCGNYQYYAYRYTGMLIGSVRENVTENGHVYPKMDGIAATNCTIKYGDWVHYYYCELVANTLASYTHDHQFSRLTQIKSLDEIKAGDTWTKTGNFLFDNECYHIVDKDGVLTRHLHKDAGEEVVNGKTVLKEDKQIVYLPFGQLFTGYGWGVTSKGLSDFAGTDSQIQVAEGQYASSVVKFEKADNVQATYEPNVAVKIGDLFKASDATVGIVENTLQVYVSPVDESSTVSATYSAGATWADGTLTFSGEGAAIVTISDYFFCTPTTITVNVAVTKTDASVIEAPVANELTYTGSAQALVSGGVAKGGELVYSTAADGVFTEAVPVGTDAGIYIVFYKVQGDKNHYDTEASSITVKIAKAASSVTKDPTAKELIYSGTAQALVNAGATNGGKLVYSLTENGAYSASIPTAADAGKYIVFYKVEADNNYNASEGGFVNVTIAKAVASATVTATQTWTYNGEAQALVKTTNIKGASVVYSLSENGEFTAIIPTSANAGTYTVYYKVLGNANYNESDVKSVTVTVKKAESAVTTEPVVKQDLTYDKTAQDLVDAGSATGGEIWYKVEKQQASTRATRSVEVDKDGFSPVIPTATNAGTYTVYYKVKGDANHKDSAVSSVTVTVKKADPVVTKPNVETTYGDTLKNAILDNSTQEVSGTLTWKDDTSTPVGNAGTNSFIATFEPEDTENYNTIEVEIPVTVQPAVPAYTLPENLQATYGQLLSDITLPEKFTWKDATQSVGNAGTNKFKVMFNPGDSNYQTLEIDVQVTVAKASPTYTAPTGLTAIYGQTLADVPLPDGFNWEKDNGTPVGNAGKQTFTVKYTPSDITNYNFVTGIEVTIEVAKADPTDFEIPKELTATYGETLKDVDLPEYFTWKNVTQSVGNAGASHSFAATYNPNKDNYNDADVTLTVTVIKADPAVPKVSNLTATYGDTLNNVALPDGFTWEIPSNPVGALGEQKHFAVYTPADKENYNTATVELTVMVNPAVVQKFETKFTGDFLYRVGNQNAVSLDSLFKAKDGITVGAVSVTVETISGASGTYTSNATWKNGTIQFANTGIVKVTITDGDNCKPTELYLEVVEALNTTSAASATEKNIVLLADCEFSSLKVSGGYTLYGNGFTMTCSSDSVAVDRNYGFVELNDGVLDNVQIDCPKFSYAILYDSNKDENGNPSQTDSNGRTRYYNIRSAVVVSGNSKIVNSRVSGGRAAIYLTGGTALIENSTIEYGAAANIHVDPAIGLTLRNVTLIQEPVKATVNDTSKTVMGLSVVIFTDGEGDATPVILEGTLCQYAWACKEYKTYVPNSGQDFVDGLLKKNAFIHSISYGDEVRDSLNLGFLYLPSSGSKAPNEPVLNGSMMDNRSDKDKKPYGSTDINGSAYVYSYMNSSGTASDTAAKPAYNANAQVSSSPTVSFTDANEARKFETAYDSVTGLWTSTLKVDVDQGVYEFSFANLIAEKYGEKLSYSVTKMDGTAVDVNNSISLADSSTSEFILVIKDHLQYNQNGEIVNKTVEHKHAFVLKSTKTSIAKPVWTSTTLNGTPYIVVDSKGGDWNCAVPVLDGLKIKYWSKKQSKEVELDLSTVVTAAGLSKGLQNGSNNSLTITVENEYTLTITSSGFKTNDNGKPVVVENKLYFTVSSSGNYVSTNTKDRAPSFTYNFTDANNTDPITLNKSFSVVYADHKSTQYKYSDFCNGKLTTASSSCVAPDTLVTLADGTQKQIQHVTAADQLLVWDHYNGQFATAPAAIIFNHGYADNTVITMNFSDGTTLKVVNLHQLLSADLNKYVTINAENVEQFVGGSFVKRDGETYTTVTLESYSVTDEYIAAFGIISAFHYNILVEDMFSTDFMEEDYQLFNYFEIGSDLLFNADKMAADIETYGLYAYDDFAEYLTEEQFEAFNVKYMKVSVGKGVYTYEKIIALIREYLFI